MYQESSLKTLRVAFGLVIFFRVGVLITNINIGPLLIYHRGYHKIETCSGNHFEFQPKFFLNFFDCMHIKHIFFTSQVQVGRPEFHHNSNLDLRSYERAGARNEAEANGGEGADPEFPHPEIMISRPRSWQG